MLARIESLESRRFLSGTWTTADDYQLAPGRDADTLGGMTADAAGNVYAVGEAYDSASLRHNIVRMKPSNSSTWTTLSDTIAGNSVGYKDIAVSSSGDVYVGGAMNGGFTVWRMRRSAGETSISVIDQPWPNASTEGYSSCASLTVDGAGSIYAVGSRYVPGKPHQSQDTWIVRKLAAGTGAFSTVDAYTYSTAINEADDVVAVSAGAGAGVYVSGTANIVSSNSTHWLIRGSTDGGVTWRVIDDFPPTADSSAGVNALTADAAGNLYAVGSVTARTVIGGTPKKPLYNYSSSWVTRKGTFSGGRWVWSMDDVLTSPASTNSSPRSIAIDPSGTLYVAGCDTVSGLSHGVVRSKSPGGNWQQVDDFLYPGGTYSENDSIAVDPSGNVYVAGYAYDGSNVSHWVVRSMVTTAPPAPSIILLATPTQQASVEPVRSLILDRSDDGVLL